MLNTILQTISENNVWVSKVELHRIVSKHVHSFLVLIIFESNTKSVKWTINTSKTDVGVVANQVKIRFGSD